MLMILSKVKATTNFVTKICPYINMSVWDLLISVAYLYSVYQKI